MKNNRLSSIPFANVIGTIGKHRVNSDKYLLELLVNVERHCKTNSFSSKKNTY